MKEDHPIDDLFRSALAEAEAAPPNSVLERILSAHAQKRSHERRRKRRSVLFLALLIAGALGSWWAINARSTAPHDPLVPGSGVNERTTSIAQERVPPKASTERVDGASYAQRPAEDTRNDLEVGASAAHDRVANSTIANKTVRSGIRKGSMMQRSGSVLGVERSELDRVAGDHSAEAVSEAGGGRDRLQWLAVLPSSLIRPIPGSVSKRAEARSGYVLPDGDWFIGVTGGYFDLQYRPAHSADQLAHERSLAERARDLLLYGVAWGRRWHSGLSISLGIESGSQRSRFEHTDRSTASQLTITENIVVFDQVVLSAFPDTIYNSSEVDLTRRAENRTNVWRVPLLLGWRHGLGRWHLGLTAGPAFSTRIQRSGYVLLSDNSDDPPQSESVDGTRRANVRLMGIDWEASAELMFDLTEQLGLSLSATYGADLVSWQADPAVQPLSARAGGRLGLIYTLPSRPR
ncbi:MAG: hypothetical protein H6594_00230 [Flavobacteriales bacterium]|nr:hypothetical protein [Flavobacteriales bacterium]